MKTILQQANEYGKTMTWKTIALFKLCCISVGMMIGMFMPKKCKEFAIPLASLVFLITYIPLMVGFIQSYRESQKQKRSPFAKMFR